MRKIKEIILSISNLNKYYDNNVNENLTLDMFKILKSIMIFLNVTLTFLIIT